MLIVRFNRWDEFLEELQSGPPDDRVVRVTFSLRYNGQRAPHVTMVAGYLSGNNQIVEFVHYLGVQSIEGEGPQSPEIHALFDKRKKCLADQGFTVRCGRYHVPTMVRWSAPPAEC